MFKCHHTEIFITKGTNSHHFHNPYTNIYKKKKKTISFINPENSSFPWRIIYFTYNSYWEHLTSQLPTKFKNKSRLPFKQKVEKIFIKENIQMTPEKSQNQWKKISSVFFPKETVSLQNNFCYYSQDFHVRPVIVTD